MLQTILGRYLLFAVLGIEALLLPYFLSKDIYGEVEFYKFTAFLAQFLLFGSGTGYVVRYLNAKKHERSAITNNYTLCSIIHVLLISLLISYVGSPLLGVLTACTMSAMAIESLIKVNEKYLLAMSFKPILSFVLVCSLPLLLYSNLGLELYVLISFGFGAITYLAFAVYFQAIKLQSFFQFSLISNLRKYCHNIKTGFLMNSSTAMLFVFFYIDRVVIREKFPSLLGDYSLSYSIMQLTIVAITTFSYVNLIQFGKNKITSIEFRATLLSALKKCFLLYIVIGTSSVVMSYGAERFYQYDHLFITTFLMVLLYGFASVLASLNSAHLYLGSVNIMTGMMAFFLTTSVLINFVIDLESVYDYYFLLFKSYVLYSLFSICSCVYIFLNLRKKRPAYE